MSDFTTVKETEIKGILRYKGRKCGEYEINENGVGVDISTATGKAAWQDEFQGDTEKINEFFGIKKSELDPAIENEPELTDEEIMEQWRNNLLASANEKENIAAVLHNGDGRIYKGPATKENILRVIGLEEVKEVLNERTDDK